MSTYNFPQSKVQDAVAIIEKTNKKAAKAGIAERIEFVTSDYMVKHVEEEGVVVFDEWCELVLTVPMVKVNDYKFVATLTWDQDAGLVTRMVRGESLTHRPEDCHCDVCNKIRNRHDTYVVRNEVTGQELQVGSGCLERFFGFTPKGLDFLEIDTVVAECAAGYVGFRSPSRFSTKQVLAVTLAVVEAKGWKSRSAVEAQGYGVATSNYVGDVLLGHWNTNEEFRFQAAMRKAAEGKAEEAAKLIDFVAGMDGSSEYVLNLKAVAASESVTLRNMPLLASAYASWLKAQEVRNAVATASQHFAKVGDKVEFAAKVTDTRLMEGAYGYTTLISFLTADGNVAKWFASGEHEYANGTEVKVKGTVKENSVYGNVKQTMLTRCKLA